MEGVKQKHLYYGQKLDISLHWKCVIGTHLQQKDLHSLLILPQSQKDPQFLEDSMAQYVKIPMVCFLST